MILTKEDVRGYIIDLITLSYFRTDRTVYKGSSSLNTNTNNTSGNLEQSSGSGNLIVARTPVSSEEDAVADAVVRSILGFVPDDGEDGTRGNQDVADSNISGGEEAGHFAVEDNDEP